MTDPSSPPSEAPQPEPPSSPPPAGPPAPTQSPGLDLTDDQAREVAGLVEQLSHDDVGRVEKGRALVRMSRIVGARARTAGAKAVTSGRLLADLLLEAAPHIPVRDLGTLVEHHHGLTGEALADALVRNATRATTSIGAAGGAVAAAEWAAMPLLITLPAEVVVETLAVAAVEVKLVAELHAVYGVPVQGSGTERAMAFAGSWASRRGIDPLKPWTIPNVLGIAGRATLGKRMIARFARNLGTLVPFFVGAAIGASVNNGETKKLAESMRHDLRRVAAERRALEDGTPGG
ncbi:MAG: hypothetical protein U0S36_00800 [Candidatus Nanopelagicales bacterium]